MSQKLTYKWQRDLSKTLADLLGEAAPEMIKRIFEREDQGDILEDFKTYFATPMMRMWQDTIAPVVSEGYNLPGAFYSRSRFEGVQKSGEEFLEQRVNPLLFGALENMEQRELQRQSIIANILTGSASFSVSPTKAQKVGGSSGSGAGIGAIAGIGASLLIPGAGLALGGLSTLEMGALGSMVGGSF